MELMAAGATIFPGENDLCVQSYLANFESQFLIGNGILGAIAYSDILVVPTTDPFGLEPRAPVYKVSLWD